MCGCVLTCLKGEGSVWTLIRALILGWRGDPETYSVPPPLLSFSGGKSEEFSRRRRPPGARWRRCASATLARKVRARTKVPGLSCCLRRWVQGRGSDTCTRRGLGGMEGCRPSGQRPAFLQGVSSPKPQVLRVFVFAFVF